MPTLQNGGISPDVKTWTFHLRPHLVWSDGAPYDARDVDYSWQLWANPKFNGGNPVMQLISSAQVSADNLSITFHLTRAYAPFLAQWVDGGTAPLPLHRFSRMSPDRILKSPEHLNPQVVIGPFLMAESKPGDHYTLVRNPRYYRASEGLPYLDKIVYRPVPIGDNDTLLKDLQAGTITLAAPFADVSRLETYRHLANYTLVTTPTSADFEAMAFNFHNTVLANHPEVRQAMAIAIDHQALIQQVWHGLATPLCTDHPSAYHPGFESDFFCSEFNPAAANKLLSDNGWVKGADGVRAKDGQRLEFEYSTTTTPDWRSEDEAILQRDFGAIGIKLDIQNYPARIFFGSFLPAGKASPPTGAVAGRYDIAEWANNFGYDPDDSSMLACDQFPSAANYFSGMNIDFYCNHALDALYQQELATADYGLRQQIFVQIHQIYLTDFPFITLYAYTYFALVHKGTHNYLPGALTEILSNSAGWWCDGGKC